MRILTPLVVGRPTVVATRFEARAKARAVPVVYRKELTPRFCAATCDYVFPLDQELVFALNEAKDVEVSLYRNDSQEWLSPVVASRVNLTLRGADFAKALAAGSAPAGGR